LPVDNFHVCPACLESGKTDILKAGVVSERTNFDSIALALVTLPMLLCATVVITTPIALFFAFRYWNQPSPVFPRSRWRLWATVFIALAQALAIGYFIYLAARGRIT
jgi:hypothetical protein